ncbi:Aurora kinase [Durusdinium trenchii]|uniref:Aurora kinase n=1 Tax=Durusdinium trenchii TaxID=1381693 RepID=A0ABP0QY43_9DINO
MSAFITNVLFGPLAKWRGKSMDSSGHFGKNRFAGLPDTRGFRVKAETSQLDGREALVLDYSHARHGDPLWGRVLFMRDELRQGPAPGVLLGLGAMGATGGMWNCAPFVLVPEMPEVSDNPR